MQKSDDTSVGLRIDCDYIDEYSNDGLCYDEADEAYCQAADCIPEEERVHNWIQNDADLTYIYCNIIARLFFCLLFFFANRHMSSNT